MRIRGVSKSEVTVAPEVVKQVIDSSARFRSRGDRRDFGLRVTAQQAQQLDTGITGATYYPYLDHVSSTLSRTAGAGWPHAQTRMI